MKDNPEGAHNRLFWFTRSQSKAQAFNFQQNFVSQKKDNVTQNVCSIALRETTISMN
jgi:hypothetical protein